MHPNDDFIRRIALLLTSASWFASPMAGVERWLLDQIGGQVARATSLVRYARLVIGSWSNVPDLMIYSS